ncbi:hypothetical protein phiV208_29 [Vibrio phage phiV208]|nr:hypothetical protein phiV208_29 [Vibrio phage phiV208]
MISFIKSLFGFDSVVNTTTKIIDKIAGTDWQPKDKADFIIRYQEATKHQSVARRVIALMVTFVWFVIVLSMVAAYIAGNILSSPEVLMIAKDMKSVANEQISQPFNLVIGFYFTVQILNGIKK